MEEKETTSASTGTPNSAGPDKTVIIAIAVALLAIVGGLVFWLGRQKQTPPTPTTFETSTPEASATPSGSPTATPKPTKTPKPTTIPAPTTQPYLRY